MVSVCWWPHSGFILAATGLFEDIPSVQLSGLDKYVLFVNGMRPLVATASVHDLYFGSGRR